MSTLAAVVIQTGSAGNGRGDETWFFGNVKDKDTEDPIVEAEIMIKKGEHEYTAYTNTEGYYEKQVEGGGEYTLIAEHADYKTEDARAVVETGDEKRVDFQLEKKDEEQETWFVGTVKDKETEDPIVEAEITIKKGEHEYTTFTNGDGAYEKQVEGGGEYTLIAEHADYKTEDARAVVETGDEKRVDFQLEKKEEPKTRFFGHVKDKDTGDPILEAKVTIKKGDTTYTTHTGEGGYYSQHVEGGGEYTLIAEKEGYNTKETHAVIETGDEKRVDFFLEKKEEEQETWFFGHVKDKDTEDPILEAEVTIRKGDTTYTTYTGEGGYYDQQVEEGGEYTLWAEHADYKTADARAVVETGDEKRVDFQLEKKEEERETWIVGNVKDKETEDPIVEAEITFKKGEHEFTTYTNAEGNYEKQFDEGGEFSIIAEHEHYKTADEHVVVETGEEKRVDFLLEKKEEEQETWFFGHVKDKDTEDPILEAEVTIRKGDTTYTTYTGEGGYYDQQVEEGGEYTLWAEKEGYNTQEKHEVVETGNEKRVDFFLEKKEEEQHTWFVGTVKDKNTEEAIVEAEITIKKGDHTYTAFTNAEGHYEKQVEGGGEYTLIAEHADYKTEDARAVVETGDEKRVDFHLEKKEEERETWFVGRVRDKATEDPIVEAEVTIKKGDHTYTTYTNAEGHYEKQVEGGGEYTLIAEHADYKTEDARAEVETGGEKHVNFLLQKKEEEQETWFVGHVKDKDTEEAIAEAEVTIRKGDHTYTTYTNAEGHYSQQVEGGGEYTLIVEHADYKTTDEHVVIETGDEKRVNFLLEKKEEEKETWFFGTVRDKDTEDPIGGVEITIKKGDQTYTVLTDEEGYYAQEVNGGGEYTLIAEKDGYKTTDASVGVETGDEKQVDFQLESEGGRGMQDVASGGDEPDTFQLQMLAVLFVGLLGTMMLIIYLPSRYFKS